MTHFSKKSILISSSIVWFLTLAFGTMYFRVPGDTFLQGLTIPAAGPRGIDFRQMYSFAVALFSDPLVYADQWMNVYPPFVTIFFSPLSLLEVGIAYQTLAILLYVAMFFSIYFTFKAIGISNQNNELVFLAVIFFAFITQTYAFNFAVERGNYDVIGLLFCVLALYFLKCGKSNWTILFRVLAIQLKLYFLALAPLFFVLGIKRICYLSIINFALLFVSGMLGFNTFLMNIGKFLKGPFFWPGNHSIKSFFFVLVHFLQTDSYDIKWGFIEKWSSRFMFLIAICVLFFMCIYFYKLIRTMKLRIGGKFDFNFSLFEVSLIGMLFCSMSLLFTTSHDYKLPIHLIPFLFFISLSYSDLSENGISYPRAIISLMAFLNALLFLPRFSVVPAIFDLTHQYIESEAKSPFEMKTLALLLIFACYVYLAFKATRSYVRK